MACDANTLMAQAAANGYYDLDDRSLKIATLQLLCSGGSGGGGAGSGGGVFRGTLAERDAFTPTTDTALWVISDSVPGEQLSTWNGSAWT